MDEIIFAKLTGAGNDFVLIDKRLNKNLTLNSKLIVSICDRRYGIGADGVLTIDDCESSDFKMEYFNADGSNGMLCGNGARSIIKYAEHTGRLKDKTTRFSFKNELYTGEILAPEKIKFNLNTPTKLKLNFKIEVLDKLLDVSFIDTGAHHVVIDVDKTGNNFESLEEFPVSEFGKNIRVSKYFEPLGTNVNFISIKNKVINIRTYERGVEAETLACGTGSVASSMISFLNGKVSPPVKLITQSGEILEVDFEFNNNKFEKVSLTGPAKLVFEGKYKIKRIIMEKVIFAIKYEVNEEKTKDFLDVVRELKNIVKVEGLEGYSIFSVKGKKNVYQEIYTFESIEAYDNYDDAADERIDILMNKLADLVKPNSTEYLTLNEI